MNHDSLIVAADDGFAETNVYCMAPGVRFQYVMPSTARSGVHGTTSVDGTDVAVHPCYETEGERFTVAPNLHNAETARFDDYPFSGMNRAIVHHALRLCAQKNPGMLARPIRLATGLPISAFYVEGRPNAEVIKRKRESLMTPIRSLDDSPVMQIEDHKVFPEGLAAWIDHAFTDELEFNSDLQDMTVGIIDVGGRTTDIAVVLPGQQIDHARTGSADIGAHDVMAQLDVELTSRFSTKLPNHLLRSALQGQIKMWGKQQDVSKEAERARNDVAQRVLREANRRLGDGVDLDMILLVGGGANLFSGLRNAFPNIVIPENPEFANARGFAKYMATSS